MSRRAALPHWLAAALMLAPLAARAADAPLALELNKLEPIAAAAGQAPGCRAYLIASNPADNEALDAFRADLVLFGADGVIARRIALDLGPVQPGRMQVRIFELRDQPCDGIGQILVNDALICKAGGADRTDCMARLTTTSRATAKLTK